MSMINIKQIKDGESFLSRIGEAEKKIETLVDARSKNAFSFAQKAGYGGSEEDYNKSIVTKGSITMKDLDPGFQNKLQAAMVPQVPCLDDYVNKKTDVLMSANHISQDDNFGKVITNKVLQDYVEGMLNGAFKMSSERIIVNGTTKAPTTTFSLSGQPKGDVILYIDRKAYFPNKDFDLSCDRKGIYNVTWKFTKANGGFDLCKDTIAEIIAVYLARD